MATRTDPYNGYNFSVEIDGITSAGFKSASGLDTSVANVPYREGTDAGLNQRALPGMVSYSNISLQRGITDSRQLYDWAQSAVGGAVTRKNLSIILCDNTGAKKIRWDLVNCWPTKWSGPSFDATGDAIAIESLEIAHEGVSVSQWT